MANTLTDKKSTENVKYQCAMMVQHQTNNAGPVGRANPPNEHDEGNSNGLAAGWI